MSNPLLIKTYDADAAIPAFTIVKLTATDFHVVPAAAVGDPLIGVTTDVAAASGDRVDVIHSGIANVVLGGTVAAGDPITTNASGAGVKANPGAGTNNNCIGRARHAGVSGDVAEVLLTPGGFVLQG